ncbi:MAG: NifB/NifX family molybdenum-iron cluster-binding protein [Bacteroidota bacterium]|nr:NifB/NifX family molybdenum-iron cluster-binding protein [Bacteroidota bacterium]
MKIAVPTRGNVVDDHFGHCEFFTVFNIDENKKIMGSEVLPSPPGCGCKSNIASILQQKGVSVMLAGNMGDGALNVLGNHGIAVYRGCSGDIRKTVEAFLQGNLNDSGETCHCHEHQHD